MPTNPILFAIPLFLITIALEIYIAKKQNKQWYRLNDAVTNLHIGVGNQVVSLFSKAFLLWIAGSLRDSIGIFRLENNVINFFWCLLLFDFLFYWAHRWSHEVNWLWAGHVVHHQSDEYNLAVALRQPWFHNIMAFFVFLPIPIIGFDPATFLIVAALHTLYQYWIHTQAIDKLPAVFEYILNTPSHHRVHHAINEQYLDKNHGGMFIIWDRLFGTFKLEEEQPKFGITTGFQSWNPFWANVHYFQELWEKSGKMKRWQDKIKLWFARPAWVPETQKEDFVYDPKPENYDVHAETKSWDFYAAIQFLIATAGLVFLMSYYEQMPDASSIGWGLAIIVSGCISGAVLEHKKWYVAAEALRIGFVLLAVAGHVQWI